MSLRYQFQRAQQIIQQLDEAEKKSLQNICGRIKRAETSLQQKSSSLMTRCIHKCKGICCRNVQSDLIISYLDFVYILALNPVLTESILECLEKEIPFFTSDCIFLKDGAGPCIFPDELRPEVCIVTFCGDTSPVKKEIAEVKRSFFRLTWFILLRKIRRWV